MTTLLALITSLVAGGAILEEPLTQPPQALVKLEAVPFTQVTIRDRFWSPRQETNRKATVEHSLKMLDKYGNLLVMQLAADGKRDGFKGLLFTDSDLYKTLEGVSYTLATHPGPKLDKRMDEIIAMIADAQMDDGYIDTWFQVTRPDKRFTNLRDWHEMYCAGHLFEAAVAHHQATGKKNFLNVATKLAGLLYTKYGPDGEVGYCGHPEPELALVKLWKVTGDKRWFELSQRMIEHRGDKIFAAEHRTPPERYDGTYWLDDVPIREHKEIKGHAVRAAYLLSGAADVARETGDQGLIKMLQRVWRNATEKRIFITGGIGPSAANEGFTVDYDLPNLTAYQETCATIAMALWGHRMGLLFGDAKYLDAVETALYNGLLSGIALDGKSFFYVNPLASMGNHHRREWYECACCPPNVLRTIASLGGYAYARGSGTDNFWITSNTPKIASRSTAAIDSFYVNLYIAGSVETELGGKKVGFDVKTDYPWDGKVEITVKNPALFALHLRKPGWCQSTSLAVNGESQSQPGPDVAGYFIIARSWKAGDKVTLNLDMPIVQMQAHPEVKEDIGRAAVQRGPLVYCAEQVDNAVPLDQVILPLGAPLKATFQKGILGGVAVVDAEGFRATQPDWDGSLYQPISAGEKVKLRLVPYGFWDNRKAGRMEVWLPSAPPTPKSLGPEGKAKISLSFTSGNSQPTGINDAVEPKSSGEQPGALCHFWPHKGGEEWVQYNWKKAQRVSAVRVYWFDDTGRGECRLPVSWKLQTQAGNRWIDVVTDGNPVARDEWCEAKFAPITTNALRLVVRQQDGWASGIHEWKVVLADDD